MWGQGPGPWLWTPRPAAGQRKSNAAQPEALRYAAGWGPRYHTCIQARRPFPPWGGAVRARVRDCESEDGPAGSLRPARLPRLARHIPWHKVLKRISGPPGAAVLLLLLPPPPLLHSACDQPRPPTPPPMLLPAGRRAPRPCAPLRVQSPQPTACAACRALHLFSMRTGLRPLMGLRARRHSSSHLESVSVTPVLSAAAEAVTRPRLRHRSNRARGRCGGLQKRRKPQQTLCWRGASLSGSRSRGAGAAWHMHPVPFPRWQHRRRQTAQAAPTLPAVGTSISQQSRRRRGQPRPSTSRSGQHRTSDSWQCLECQEMTVSSSWRRTAAHHAATPARGMALAATLAGPASAPRPSSSGQSGGGPWWGWLQTWRVRVQPQSRQQSRRPGGGRWRAYRC